jgi:16S rRNA processing protein RimM
VPLVRVGILLNSHGVHGLAKFACTSDNPQWLTARERYLLTDPATSQCHIVQLEKATMQHDGCFLGKLDVFDAPEPVKLHHGWELLFFARRGEMPREGDEVYYFELPGLQVRNSSGDVIGVVCDVLDSGAHILLGVDTLPSRFIPFTRQYVPTVDLEHGYLVTTYPLDAIVDES